MYILRTKAEFTSKKAIRCKVINNVKEFAYSNKEDLLKDKKQIRSQNKFVSCYLQDEQQLLNNEKSVKVKISREGKIVPATTKKSNKNLYDEVVAHIHISLFADTVISK